MKKCIFHGNYSGSVCPQCDKIESEKEVEKDTSFTSFILKSSFFMTFTIAIGWFLFSL